jgi:RNA polymerase sigma factor (sigma-70 family)
LSLPLVYVLDDDVPFGTAIGRMLQASGYEARIYTSAKDLIDQLPEDQGPSCLLLDVRIPGISGPQLQDLLRERGSALPIIFLTGYGDIPTSVSAIKAGAEDFLTKPVPREVLLSAIERAIARSRATEQERSRARALREKLESLTPRERQVFDLVVRGKMNKQIAHDLGTTERTIKAHRQRVMEKVETKSLAELVSIAERLGLLERC